MDVIGSKTGDDNPNNAADTLKYDQQHNDAASIVQRAWRSHSMRKQKLSSDARWKDTIVNARMKVENNAAQDIDKNDPKSRWRRGVFLAGRLQDGKSILTEEEDSAKDDPDLTKALATQHWLELVDPKHRYGSNLKYYHEKWVEADTEDNFFKWLDRGDGKGLTLPECSRERLETERIMYLSAEQRLNYLIKIDPDGKIRWARNDQYVDTAPGVWTDAGEGKGIIKADDQQAFRMRPKQEGHTNAAVLSSSSKDQNSPDEAMVAKHYHGPSANKDLNFFQKIWKDSFTTHGLMDRLLRKTVKKNTWLYVADKDYNVYVGLKETGYFQHSSFTSGGLVTSAGLITVDNGLVTSLSPLSGHYRTSIDHYKQFVEEMDKRGLDLHKVHMTKGEALLWGLEHWKAFTSTAKSTTKKAKVATNAVIHPKEAKEKREKAKEKAKDEEEAKQALEPAHSPESQKSKVEEAKLIALRKKVEKMRKDQEEEDQQWKSGAQWRWEVITGRHQQSKKKDERKWKDAMESREHTSAQGPPSDPRKSGKETAVSDDSNAAPSGSKDEGSHRSTAKPTAESSSNGTQKSDNPEMKDQMLAKRIVHAEPPNNFRAGESNYESPSDMMLRDSEFAQKQGKMQGQGQVRDERKGQKHQQHSQEDQQEARPKTPEERPPAYEEGTTRQAVETLAEKPSG